MTSPNKNALWDPVCGMPVQPDSPLKASYKSQEFAFCSSRCLKLFQDEPERYLEPGGEKPEKASAPTGAVYTCPMDPEIRQKEPGPCPKCGMALEPIETEAPLTRTEWTCPMHPEVVQDSPGTCPKCGMALEPCTVYVKEEENPELRDMRHRSWVSGAQHPLGRHYYGWHGSRI